MPKLILSATKTCRNYHDGIAALAAESWDVLWLDYDMGIGCYNGIDVLEWLKKNPQHLPKRIVPISMSSDAREKMRDIINIQLYNRWYRKIHSTSYVAYVGNQAIAEAADVLGLRAQLNKLGYGLEDFQHTPLRIIKV